MSNPRPEHMIITIINMELNWTRALCCEARLANPAPMARILHRQPRVRGGAIETLKRSWLVDWKPSRKSSMSVIHADRGVFRVEVL